jgi:hypothetical protein
MPAPSPYSWDAELAMLLLASRPRPVPSTTATSLHDRTANRVVRVLVRHLGLAQSSGVGAQLHPQIACHDRDWARTP